MTKTYSVVWDVKAKEALKEIFDYIKDDSPSAAKKVRITLLQLAASLRTYPNKFAAEPYLAHKGKNYRSVTKWSYKLIYRVGNDEVRILAIIHTKRNTSVFDELG
ncbi:MAG: hypothetical protein Roseis2KO_24020 [Roseivirga sp.]